MTVTVWRSGYHLCWAALVALWGFLCSGWWIAPQTATDEQNMTSVLLELAQRTRAVDARTAPAKQLQEIHRLLRDVSSERPWPISQTGGVLDYYLNAQPSAGLATFDEYVAERLLGLRSGKMLPEEVSRELAEMAFRIDRLITNTAQDLNSAGAREDLSALALLARYHSRKILAGAGLALFYASGDESALESAEGHAAACSEIWQRLAGLAGESLDVFSGQQRSGRWKEDLAFVRYDVARLRETRINYERYGLFDLGLIFGPRLDFSTPQNANSTPMDRRFRSLDPGMTYSDRRGYGWLENVEIRSAVPMQISLESLAGEDPAGLILPPAPLFKDYLRASRRATLLADLPEGDYTVTSIVGNTPELAAGSFQIRAGESAIVYPLGESGRKSMNVHLDRNRLAVDFVPESGSDWLVSGLIIARRAPHIAHIPLRTVAPGSRTIVEVTITAPDGVKSASIDEIIPSQARPATMDLLPDGRQFETVLEWRPDWEGKEVRYHITATDTLGHVSRLPSRGEFTVRISR